MATNYPSTLDNGTSLPYPSSTDDLANPNLAAGQNNQNDAVIAVETLIGTNSTQTAPVANTVLTSPAAGTNEWQGLTSAYVASSTGTGAFVFDTSPTLASPTLNSPVINSPSFSGSMGNISTGTISASGLISANGGLTIPSTASFSAPGLVTFADLLSTIFSGQVTSYTNTGTGGGTAYYINIGGFKVNWGIFANAVNAYNSSNLTVNFNNAYSQIPSTGAWQASSTNDARNYYTPVDNSTTGFGVQVSNPFNTTNSTGTPGWFAIGV